MIRKQTNRLAWNLIVVISFFWLIYLPARDRFSFEITSGDYWALLTLLPAGIFYTLIVTVLGSIAAIIFGLLIGYGKLSKQPGILLTVSIYTEVFRGIPLLVLLFYVYYAIGEFLHIPALVAAILSFGLCYGAYMADVFRAGIEAIPKDQIEAARSLGMTQKQAIKRIIMPQALRTIIPAIGNQTLGMLKDTSLVSVLAISDILRIGNEYATKHFNYFETYTYIALIYLVLTLIMSRLIQTLEDKLSIPGQ